MEVSLSALRAGRPLPPRKVIWIVQAENTPKHTHKRFVTLIESSKSMQSQSVNTLHEYVVGHKWVRSLLFQCLLYFAVFFILDDHLLLTQTYCCEATDNTLE
jgi:hypothetical protein